MFMYLVRFANGSKQIFEGIELRYFEQFIEIDNEIETTIIPTKNVLALTVAEVEDEDEDPDDGEEQDEDENDEEYDPGDMHRELIYCSKKRLKLVAQKG